MSGPAEGGAVPLVERLNLKMSKFNLKQAPSLN